MNWKNIAKVFLVYGFLGWALENIWNPCDFLSCHPMAEYCFSEKICFFPFLFLYGLGGIFIMVLREKYPNLSWLSLVILFVIVFNLIELAGGIFSEKYICSKVNTCPYGTKLWNYTRTPNWEGHIDVEHTVYWAVIGTIGYLVYPYLMEVSVRDMVLLMAVIWFSISAYKYKE